MKKQKITITQEDGVITISRNNEVESLYHIDKVVERIKSDEMSTIGLANMIAEIMHDCLNCKSATAALKDLNEKDQYFGTYFENIDSFTD
jgi:hypothetical protein